MPEPFPINFYINIIYSMKPHPKTMGYIQVASYDRPVRGTKSENGSIITVAAVIASGNCNVAYDIRCKQR